MNALFGTVSKLSFAFLAVQKANSALGQDCADDGHRAWLGGLGWWWGAFWGGHVGSYRRRGCFSQGSALVVAAKNDAISTIRENRRRNASVLPVMAGQANSNTLENEK